MALLTEVELAKLKQRGAWVRERCDNPSCCTPILSSFCYTTHGRKEIFCSRECRTTVLGVRITMKVAKAKQAETQKVVVVGSIAERIISLIVAKNGLREKAVLARLPDPAATVSTTIAELCQRGHLWRDGKWIRPVDPE